MKKIAKFAGAAAFDGFGAITDIRQTIFGLQNIALKQGCCILAIRDSDTLLSVASEARQDLRTVGLIDESSCNKRSVYDKVLHPRA